MTDIWVCGNCHSVNRQRSKKCYKCGELQATADTGVLATHRQEEAITARSVVRYRPSSALGFMTCLFLLALAGITIAQLVLEIRAYPLVLDALDNLGSDSTTAKLLDAALDSLPYAIAGFGIVIFTLLFFGAWLSRVVSNVPALGGGIPGTSPGAAFRQTLIPLVNLWKVPGIITDVLYRLDPTGGGIFMVGIAWVGLVGSWIISFVAGWYIDLRLQFDAFNAATLDEYLQSAHTLIWAGLIIDAVCAVLIAIGAVVLIALIVRIERRSRNRDAEVRAVASALE